MSRTMAVHVGYKSLYISLPFSAKQQREMTKALPHVSEYFWIRDFFFPDTASF